MSDIIGVMKSRNGASVACMVEKNRYSCMVEKPEGNRVMGEGHQYVGRQGVDWIYLDLSAWDRNQW